MIDTQGALVMAKDHAVAVAAPRLPAMPPEAVEKVRQLEAISLALVDQEECPTEHLIHGGMYCRTLHMKAGTVMTGALLKLATVLIVQGDCTVFIGQDQEESVLLRGYSVLPGSAGRKQAFFAHTDVSMTMVFPTSASTVLDCEKQFTDDWAQLLSNRQDCVTTTITGE